MKPITETSTPRKGFQNGELTEEHLAAQLGAVVRSPGACPVYSDPDASFELTYPTAELKEDVRRVFGRVHCAFDNSTLETHHRDEGPWRFDRRDRASDTEATLAVWGHPLVDGLRRTRVKADSGHGEQVQP